MPPQSPPPSGTRPLSPTAPYSSPSSPTSIGSRRNMEKRIPSVTPRRFRRFFTPRSFVSRQSRTALRIMGSAAVNSLPPTPPSPASPASDPPIPSSPTQNHLSVINRQDKRKRNKHQDNTTKRRRGLLPGPSPLTPPRIRHEGFASQELARPLVQPQTEPRTDLLALTEGREATLSQFFKACRKAVPGTLDKTSHPGNQALDADASRPISIDSYKPQPIRKFRNRGLEAELLDRLHGFSSHTGKQHLALPACDPRVETGSFYSLSSDLHHCTAFNQQTSTIPFCLASCHTAPFTAIGDEQGYVRLFSTTRFRGIDSKVNVYVKVHDNAIMDLEFSRDDSRLASACGDRSGRVLDIPTQTVAVELGNGHWDSLRQISFQPGSGNGHVLATSDRAGRLQIWDLRCSSLPAQCFSGVGEATSQLRDEQLDVTPARTVNTIDGAHERTVQGNTTSASVTAIQWMPAGREHLILSASEANASIRLWDTRYIRPRRQNVDTPLSSTPEPVTHAWRSHGITSLALATDASRLYALCRDSTLYAYSTSHLILGQAPELVDGASRRRPTGSRGLGPLYGLRHDLFRAHSFYVKCAIRPRRGSKPELLAVGSSDSCAVLFPTDERYMRAAWARREHQLADGPASASSDRLPIYHGGTPLIRGHSREVTTLSWSHTGRLVTASDDYIVRHWQQDDARARHLRQVGEFGGERHMAGWADVTDDWDRDEA